MNLLMFAYIALLFLVLTPGVLLRLPPNGSKIAVAVTHGVVFAVVWHFTHKMVLRASYEGFMSGAGETCTSGTDCMSGTCTGGKCE
jgi:hypothetical protein